MDEFMVYSSGNQLVSWTGREKWWVPYESNPEPGIRRDWCEIPSPAVRKRTSHRGFPWEFCYLRTVNLTAAVFFSLLSRHQLRCQDSIRTIGFPFNYENISTGSNFRIITGQELFRFYDFIFQQSLSRSWFWKLQIEDETLCRRAVGDYHSNLASRTSTREISYVCLAIAEPEEKIKERDGRDNRL